MRWVHRLFPPVLPGIDHKNVVFVEDVELGKTRVGDKVVVAGAGLTGSETALHLAQMGKSVTLIDMLSLEQIDNDAVVINTLVLRNLLRDSKVVTLTEVKLVSIASAGVELIDKDQNNMKLACDTLVLALGVKPRLSQVEEFQGLAPAVYLIGDCNNQRGNLFNAVSEGLFSQLWISDLNNPPG